MKFRHARNLGLLILTTVFAVNVANAQGRGAPSSGDASEVRDQLQDILQKYPPTLREVLQRDSSLLNDPAYLAPYPILAAYIPHHPEIAHNPVYFLGSPNNPRDYQPSIGDDVERVTTPLMVSIVVIVLIYTLGLIIRGIINHRRWLRISKLQTETQNKLLERFSSNEEMLAFIQTPAGKRFLESASLPAEIGPRAVSAPVGRILWSIQVGIVVLVAGAGLEIISYRMTDTDAGTAFRVAGVFVIALGVGFVLSALGSYVLSKRLGLFDSPAPPAS